MNISRYEYSMVLPLGSYFEPPRSCILPLHTCCFWCYYVYGRIGKSGV